MAGRDARALPPALQTRKRWRLRLPRPLATPWPKVCAAAQRACGLMPRSLLHRPPARTQRSCPPCRLQQHGAGQLAGGAAEVCLRCCERERERERCKRQRPGRGSGVQPGQSLAACRLSRPGQASCAAELRLLVQPCFRSSSDEQPQHNCLPAHLLCTAAEHQPGHPASRGHSLGLCPLHLPLRRWHLPCCQPLSLTRPCWRQPLPSPARCHQHPAGPRPIARAGRRRRAGCRRAEHPPG